MIAIEMNPSFICNSNDSIALKRALVVLSKWKDNLEDLTEQCPNIEMVAGMYERVTFITHSLCKLIDDVNESDDELDEDEDEEEEDEDEDEDEEDQRYTTWGALLGGLDSDKASAGCQCKYDCCDWTL